jgi:hypothetical protein
MQIQMITLKELADDVKHTDTDCRTCAKSFKHGSQCRSTAQCVNGDQYVSVPPIQLWEKR